MRRPLTKYPVTRSMARGTCVGIPGWWVTSYIGGSTDWITKLFFFTKRGATKYFNRG